MLSNALSSLCRLPNTSPALFTAVSRALGETGTIAAHVDEQMGEPQLFDFLGSLVHYEYESAMEYGEFVAGRPSNFIVAFKDPRQRFRWFVNEAELTLALRQRECATVLGESSFQHFDAATMMSFQYPTRLGEDSWCRSHPKECQDGHGIDPEQNFAPQSSFEVKVSQIAKGGRGVFTKESLAAGTLIAPDECVHGMFCPPLTYAIASDAAETFGNASDFWGKEAARICDIKIAFSLTSHCISQIRCLRT